jgi:hypothetical protein
VPTASRLPHYIPICTKIARGVGGSLSPGRGCIPWKSEAGWDEWEGGDCMRKALLIALIVTVLVLGMIGTAFAHDLTVVTPSGQTPVVAQPTGDNPVGRRDTPRPAVWTRPPATHQEQQRSPGLRVRPTNLRCIEGPPAPAVAGLRRARQQRTMRGPNPQHVEDRGSEFSTE